ncbi:hypothetical protein DFJ73DRAFT_963398 [Zopfochytrium polystomum]|nr:hypothetical protein DFJ73DRAFT_963398 [Zopfochytrium polystomum]
MSATQKSTTTTTTNTTTVTPSALEHQKHLQPELQLQLLQRLPAAAASSHRLRPQSRRVPLPTTFVAVACAAITVSALLLLNSAPSLFRQASRSIARSGLSKLVIGGAAPPQNAEDPDRMIEQGARRIATSESDVRWMDEIEVSDIVRNGVGFMDVTDGDLDAITTDRAYIPKAYEVPTSTSFQSITAAITANMSTSSLQAWFTDFTTNFKDRSFRSLAGSDASDWIFNQVIDASMSRSGRLRSKTHVEVKSFRHPWQQASVIARMDGQVGAAEWEQPVVVLAAHIDSRTVAGQPSIGDPDAAGAAVLFEVYRAILASGFSPNRPIELHWYAAHAGGLLGSQKVAAEYRRAGKPVLGVLAVDPRGGLAGHDSEDRVLDEPLERFIQRVVEDYADGSWIGAQCGFACSDQISWKKAGYASARLANSTTFTEKDESASANILRFAKLAVAFAVELSLF